MHFAQYLLDQSPVQLALTMQVDQWQATEILFFAWSLFCSSSDSGLY